MGQTDEGTPIYTYRYVWGGPVQMGVMAQDVPDAAIDDPERVSCWIWQSSLMAAFVWGKNGGLTPEDVEHRHLASAMMV